eukprot:TRINITY_DN14379_c0_g1_i1.p1 TRINITY_DN14379_c0_g1~~TRINITY_DN14379_c0_g1_i1.p1  ORF type:complete len:134 (+),score=16.74 TRINITY_DN14379_c0_g1_i1:43-402(+)
MENKTTLSSHVLDQTLGVPAFNVPVTLQKQNSEGFWETLGTQYTKKEGRISVGDFPPLPSEGLYRLSFNTRSYFASINVTKFLFPEVVIVFELKKEDLGKHFHIPLLLSPFGYSTYRGS